MPPTPNDPVLKATSYPQFFEGDVDEDEFDTMPPTPNDPVLKATSYPEFFEGDVDGDEFDTMPPTPNDPVFKAKPCLECLKDDVHGDEKEEEEEEEEEEDLFYKNWSKKEIRERFENWFRKYPDRPKGIDTYCAGQKIVRGMPLMEVFDVRITSRAKSKPAIKLMISPGLVTKKLPKSRRKLNLNGRITVEGSYGESEIFARTRENPEKLCPKESLSLTGPIIGTLGYDRVIITLDLKDGNRQVCEGELVWSSSASRFNHPRTSKVEGKKGFDFHVQYAVYPYANLITVGIELPTIINNGQNVLVETVEAYIETAECRFPKTTLFNWKRNNVEANSEGGELRLTKSLMACPVGGTFVLDLVFRNNSNSSVTTKHVRFVPTRYGRTRMGVRSEYGSFVVTFKAYPVEVHPPTLERGKLHFWSLFWPEGDEYSE